MWLFIWQFKLGIIGTAIGRLIVEIGCTIIFWRVMEQYPPEYLNDKKYKKKKITFSELVMNREFTEQLCFFVKTVSGHYGEYLGFE